MNRYYVASILCWLSAGYSLIMAMYEKPLIWLLVSVFLLLCAIIFVLENFLSITTDCITELTNKIREMKKKDLKNRR